MVLYKATITSAVDLDVLEYILDAGVNIDTYGGFKLNRIELYVNDSSEYINIAEFTGDTTPKFYQGNDKFFLYADQPLLSKCWEVLHLPLNHKISHSHLVLLKLKIC